MKYIKTFEYNRKYSEESRVDFYLRRQRKQLFDFLYDNALLGIIPQKTLDLNDNDYSLFVSKLTTSQQNRINDITNNISNYIDEELIKNIRLKNTEYDKENKEFVFNTIINNLKNGISMKDTIETEFKDINLNNVLSMLTDKDKELINKYQKEMSNTPENKKRPSSLDNKGLDGTQQHAKARKFCNLTLTLP